MIIPFKMCLDRTDNEHVVIEEVINDVVCIIEGSL